MHFSLFLYTMTKKKINSSSESNELYNKCSYTTFFTKIFFKYTKKRIYIILNERKKGKKLMKKIFLK